jgi:plasmid replication initiation protein
MVEFHIDELKELLSATCYARYPDFRRNVLEIAMKEIEALSDINVSYEIIKEGRKYARIRFLIHIKQDLDERFGTWKRIQGIIGQ